MDSLLSKHPTTSLIPLGAPLFGRSAESRAGGTPTIVALPMVADLAAHHEFRHFGRDHGVATMRAAHRRGEGADTGELGGIAVELHGLLLSQVPSTKGEYRRIVATERRFGETVVADA